MVAWWLWHTRRDVYPTMQTAKDYLATVPLTSGGLPEDLAAKAKYQVDGLSSETVSRHAIFCVWQLTAVHAFTVCH
jgi:hypothetical protein